MSTQYEAIVVWRLVSTWISTTGTSGNIMQIGNIKEIATKYQSEFRLHAGNLWFHKFLVNFEMMEKIQKYRVIYLKILVLLIWIPLYTCPKYLRHMWIISAKINCTKIGIIAVRSVNAQTSGKLYFSNRCKIQIIPLISWVMGWFMHKSS